MVKDSCFLLRSFITIFISLFISGCAQVVAPTGGEKDTTPPVILKSTPENGSTLFNSNEIELEFDEFIVLKNLNEQLIVSPPLKYKLKSKIKGKKLILEIEDTLKENTTYVLNFGNAITDLNEGNPVLNYQYVFSTGGMLDSLSLSGKLLDAFTLGVEEKAYVMLYPKFESDSVPSKELPTYVTKTDKEGNFNISNIKEGSYQLFALKDANNNYLYDRPDEKVAFIDTLLLIDSNQIKNIVLYSFAENKDKQFLEEQKMNNTRLALTFKLPVNNFKYELLDTNSNLVIKTRQVENKVYLWLKEMDNVKLKMRVEEGEFLDTISFKVDSLPTASSLKLKEKLSPVQNFYESISLVFDQPIVAMDVSSMKVLDSDSASLSFKINKDSINDGKAWLQFPFMEDSTYQIQFLPGSFTDIYGRTNDTISSAISFNKAENFGKLILTITTSDTLPKILQLTDSRGKVLREKYYYKGLIEFPYLKPGTYHLKLIFDANNNGKWDSGNFYNGLQPERTLLFDEPISIRENWDKEINWIIPK